MTGGYLTGGIWPGFVTLIASPKFGQRPSWPAVKRQINREDRTWKFDQTRAYCSRSRTRTFYGEKNVGEQKQLTTRVRVGEWGAALLADTPSSRRRRHSRIGLLRSMSVWYSAHCLSWIVSVSPGSGWQWQIVCRPWYTVSPAAIFTSHNPPAFKSALSDGRRRGHQMLLTEWGIIQGQRKMPVSSPAAFIPAICFVIFLRAYCVGGNCNKCKTNNQQTNKINKHKNELVRPSRLTQMA